MNIIVENSINDYRFKPVKNNGLKLCDEIIASHGNIEKLTCKKLDMFIQELKIKE